jgi:hypothetical protein
MGEKLTDDEKYDIFLQSMLQWTTKADTVQSFSLQA